MHRLKALRLCVNATFVLALTLNSFAVRADTALIAVASNFMKPAKEISAAFNKQSPHTVRLSFGSSGKLYAQILHGAPYHAFLSADTLRPQLLLKNNQGSQTSLFTYAVGELVLFSRNIALKADSNTAFKLPSTFNKLAIANPKTAPYGIAAMEALTHLKLANSAQEHLVYGENINQCFQFAYSGHADLAIIAKSQLTNIDKEHWQAIPQNAYTAIEQQALLLNKGEENKAAIAFLNYLQSDDAKAIIIKHHYHLNAN